MGSDCPYSAAWEVWGVPARRSRASQAAWGCGEYVEIWNARTMPARGRTYGHLRSLSRSGGPRMAFVSHQEAPAGRVGVGVCAREADWGP